MNYSNDGSLFFLIKIPGQYGYDELQNWFQCDPNAKWTLLVDSDLDNTFPRIDMIHNIYPNIKTVGIVCNPWFRVAVSYKNLRDQFLAGIHSDFSSLTNLEDFDSFLFSISEKKITPFWFNLATPQVDWLKTQIISADYIFRYETLSTDILNLQKCFSSTRPIKYLEDFKDFDYRSFYNTKTKNLISEIFSKDIQEFNYEF